MRKPNKFLTNLKVILKKGLETGEEEEYTEKIGVESNARFIIPYLTQNEEENMINKLSERIKKLNLELPAIIFLETIKPINRLVSQLYGFYVAPFFEIFGLQGYAYSIFFNKRKNLENLISKLKNK